ncbi:thioesterase domain containing protein [Ophiostoma piceae UAMH 11346]|uniref:Thioesterase domain containing protein n=1 Tax=Ophiostoma piceae (strain UAMH 11346) TaxID=1262450 RepID=S3C9L9_OPHP1|nr:thioesterase domain containing protein [Ophiostoma piceae UAMH 11346]
MFDSNPNLIQDGLRTNASRNAAPLVLFHDGGGTIFSYHLLDDLGRKVWGIANPRFKTRIPWDGGLREMGAAYAKYVATAVPYGPVILGGWSLGGVLAIETATVLAQSYPRIEVLGLVLIDSVCPVPPRDGWAGAEARLVKRHIEWPATTAPATKVSVEWCFGEAFRTVREWQLPIASLPPAVLIRCQEPVPVPDDGLLYVDLNRRDRHLGWDNYRPRMFCQVLDVSGNHYNVFAFDRLEEVTDLVKTACRTIESESKKAANG